MSQQLNVGLLKSRMLGWECIVLLAWSRRHSRGSHPSDGPQLQPGSWRKLCFMELEERENWIF